MLDFSLSCKLLMLLAFPLLLICSQPHTDHTDALACTGLLPDVKKIVISYLDSWEVKNLDRPKSLLLTAFYSSDSCYLVVVSQWQISLFDVKTHILVHDFPTNKTVICAAISPDGKVVAVSQDKQIAFLDLHTLSWSSCQLSESQLVSALTYSPDGQYLACGDTTGAVSIRRTCRPIGTCVCTNGLEVGDTAMSPITSSQNNIMQSILPEKIFSRSLENYIFCLAISPDSKYLALCTMESKVIKVIEILTGSDTCTLRNRRKITSLGFLANSKHLACADAGKHVSVWELKTGLRAYTLASSHAINKIACSPNGKYIAGTTDASVVLIWDCQSRKEISRCAHEEDDYQQSIAFSPDGQSIAVGLTSTNKPVVILSNQAVCL